MMPSSRRPLDHNYILIVLLALFVVAPLTRPGSPATGVGYRPVWNLSALERCGGWPSLAETRDLVRGDGLLPRYVALGFAKLGSPLQDAIKWSLALAYLIGGLAMYGWLRGRWGWMPAIAAGVVYTFLPYRLSVTYVAGGLGEPWALALYPVAGWALWNYAEQSRPRQAILALVGWVPLALANVGLAILFALIAGVAVVAATKRPRPALPLLLALPVMAWALYSGTAADLDTHYPYLFQLFSASWHSAPSGAGWITEMPFQLGLVPVGLALLAVADSAGRDGTRQRSVTVLTAGVVLSVLLSLRISDPLWRVSRLDRLLTYPWQMLGFASLGLALLAGMAVRQTKTLRAWPWLAGIIALMVISVYGYLDPAWADADPGDAPVALFGQNHVALVDYQLTGLLYPGAEVQLDVQWQSLRPLDRDYTVFVQALDATQQVRGQEDTQPLGGERPTSSWVPGEIVSDTYIVRVNPDGPPDGYSLIIGFYDLETGERLPVGGDDKAVLSTHGEEASGPAWSCEEVAR